MLLEEDAAAPVWLGRLPVAARFEACGARALVHLVEETADRYRGETFVVAAPWADILEALGARGISAAPPLAVEIDSAGWRPGPGR